MQPGIVSEVQNVGYHGSLQKAKIQLNVR